MIWEIYQQGQIQDAKSSASRAELKAENMFEYFRMLEGKLESLALACQSLWEILRDNTDLSEEELLEKMQEIDLRDGRVDGRLSTVAEQCSQCGRKTSRRRVTCLYCGARNPAGEIFGRQPH